MAKILLNDPLAALSGRIATNEKIIFRTRNGRTHAYVVTQPNTREHSDKQKANSTLFGAISAQVRTEMTDATRRAVWEKEFAAYTKRHNPASKRVHSSNEVQPYQSRRKPPISTLYGYIFHTLYEQARHNASEPVAPASDTRSES